MIRKIKFYEVKIDNDIFKNSKIDGIVVMGMGLNRARTAPCEQSKALTNVGVHLALQKNTPLIIVGMEEQPNDVFFRNESRLLVDYIKEIFKKEYDKISISTFTKWSLLARCSEIIKKMQEKNWHKIAIILHADQVGRVKKMLKISSYLLENGDELEFFLIPLNIPYNGDNYHFWKREKFLNVLYETYCLLTHDLQP
ncbi:MAG: hypothetical protein N2692_02245 [Patescibacteria group bacterium]|jgi:hypothetical protein|nr:hypothetical protein [Patescibacteria group bacterium]